MVNSAKVTRLAGGINLRSQSGVTLGFDSMQIAKCYVGKTNRESTMAVGCKIIHTFIAATVGGVVRDID